MTEPGTPALLLLDDDPHVLSSLARALRPLRLPTRSAASAEQAAAHLAAGGVGVILCEPHDQRLADVLVQARRSHPSAVRVILTGYPNLDRVIGAVNEAHPFKMLTKPWVDEELRAQVQQAVQRHQGLRQQDQLLHDMRSVRTATERAHAFRALGPATQSMPELGTPATLAALPVAAVLLSQGQLALANAPAQQIFQALGEPLPPLGTPLQDLAGVLAELAAAAQAAPRTDGISERTAWRASTGQRLDFHTRQLEQGLLLTFACLP